MNEEPRHSRAQTSYATEDKTGRVLSRSGLRKRVIALDNALNAQPFRLNGDFLYADHLSTGTAFVQLNNTSEDLLPFTAQSKVKGFPIQDIFVTCAAQPGLVLNLWYGFLGEIDPPQSVVQLSGGVSILQTAVGVPQGPDQASFNGKRFYGSVDAGGGAAQFTYIILSNPVGSGVTVYVDKIKAYQFAASLPVMLVSGNAIAGGASGFNSLIGGAASLAKLNTVLNATDAGAGFGNLASVDSVLVSSSVSVVVPEPGPIILPAGKAVAIRPQQANNQISGLYVWREI